MSTQITCLDDHIGIRDVVGFDTSNSGLYINDLPGISTRQLDKIKDSIEDYSDVGNAWEQIRIRAQQRLQADIRIHMKKYFRNIAVVDNGITGQFDINTNEAAANKMKGHLFDYSTISKNLELHLNYAQLYMNAGSNFTIKIYNASTGELITSKSYIGNATGIVKLDLQLVYAVHEYPQLFVCYEDTGLDLKRSSDLGFGAFSPVGSYSVTIGTSPIMANLTGDTSGLVLAYQLRCSLENYICQNIDLLTYAYWYALATEFMLERVHSDSLNRYTMIDRNRAMELVIEFKNEYTEKLDSVLHDIIIEEDGYCFVCAREMNLRTVLP